MEIHYGHFLQVITGHVSISGATCLCIFINMDSVYSVSDLQGLSSADAFARFGQDMHQWMSQGVKGVFFSYFGGISTEKGVRLKSTHEGLELLNPPAKGE